MLLSLEHERAFRVHGDLLVCGFVLFCFSKSARVGLSLPDYVSIPCCSSVCPFSTHTAAFLAFVFVFKPAVPLISTPGHSAILSGLCPDPGGCKLGWPGLVPGCPARLPAHSGIGRPMGRSGLQRTSTGI